MPWHFLDDRAVADLAFSATGTTREELFQSAVDALVSAMVSDLDSVTPREKRDIELSAETVDDLLSELMQEVISFRHGDGLLLRVESIRVTEGSGGALPVASLSATMRGDRIDPKRHRLSADVKAVSLYRGRIEAVQDGWEAGVVLDVLPPDRFGAPLC
jgi:SHS2 domain-containing protein